MHETFGGADRESRETSAARGCGGGGGGGGLD